MSEDWRDVLRERYSPWMDDLPYGIECKDGWRALVEATLESLVAAVGSPADCPDLRIVRLRQKFGWLVVQHHGLLGEQPLAVDRVMARAMAMSSETCEVCGRSGRQREDEAWQALWRTLCDECRDGGRWR